MLVRTYSGVRSMSADGDQANIPVTFSLRLLVRSNDCQAGVFSCRARVWLQRARVEAGDLAKVLLEFL